LYKNTVSQPALFSYNQTLWSVLLKCFVISIFNLQAFLFLLASNNAPKTFSQYFNLFFSSHHLENQTNFLASFIASDKSVTFIFLFSNSQLIL